MRSSFAEFLKDTTDAHQLKLKLLTTTTHSEHKPRIGFITINKACSTKSQSFTREFMFARQGKIDAYIKKVAETRVRKRDVLIKMLTNRARFHLCAFDKFFYSVFGKDTTNQMILNLRTHYHDCVDVKVKSIIEKFDRFQHYYEPRLIMHYVCCFKCATKFTIISLVVSLPKTL